MSARVRASISWDGHPELNTYEDVSVRLDSMKLPQALVYRQSPKRGWQAAVALPSLHPNAIVRGALLYAATACDVASREPISIKIVGTGEYR